MTYELFQQGPEVFIPSILLSLVITVIAYGAFPLIFAKIIKKTTSKKKYNTICFCVNIIVMVIFSAIGGGSVSGGAYLLWTWVFAGVGQKTLEERGLLGNTQSNQHAEISTDTIENTKELVQTNESLKCKHASEVEYCYKCGEKMIDGSNFCRKCGTSVNVDYGMKKSLHLKRRINVSTWIMVCLSVICIILIVSNRTLENQVEDLTHNNEHLQTILSDQNETLIELNEEIQELQGIANNYNHISAYYRFGSNLGYASSSFRVNDSIIVLRRNSSKEIPLVNYKSEISVSQTNNHAGVSLGGYKWGYPTSLIINGNSVGATIVELDDRNSSFNILVIVTER